MEQDDEEYKYTDECAAAWIEDQDAVRPSAKALADYIYSGEGDYPHLELARISIDLDKRRREALADAKAAREARDVATEASARLTEQITVQANTIASLQRELRMFREVTTRIVDVSDPDQCDHNRRVDPDTGECLDCGTVLP